MMDWQSLAELDRELLMLFNGSDSLFLDGLMLALTSGFTWLPMYVALFYLVIKNNETMAQILLIIGCVALCLLLADGVADGLVKPWVARWRPSHDPVYKYAFRVVDGLRDTKYGFFSAHAANTFSLAVFFSLLVRQRLFTFFMVSWSLVCCYTRMYLGLHYPGDILCGLLWGGVSGTVSFLVYQYIYNRISPRINYISSQYTRTGYDLDDIHIVISMLVLCYGYSVIRGVTYFS